MKRLCLAALVLLVAVALGLLAYNHWLAPTRILIVNPLPSQAADIALSNDSRHIRVTCRPMDKLGNLGGFDAVLMYGRNLSLDEEQMQEVERVAARGVPVFTYTLRSYNFMVHRNLSDAQRDTLQLYFQNPSLHNYRQLLRFVRHLSTPHRLGDQTYEPHTALPYNLYYHLEYGQYFPTPEALTTHLRQRGLYHEGGRRVAFISGVTFPTEGNRAHVDTLIARLTRAGMNVYPLTASGQDRANRLRELHPDAVVYLPLGRLGNDSLIAWTQTENIPLFTPFPLAQKHEDWLNGDLPVTGGTLTARVVIPEIDGGMAPLCIATQNPNADGYYTYTPEPERVDAFIEHITRYMALRDKPNAEKRVAIGYFKSPGRDALLASGMEVIPSLYHFLCRLRAEGYSVDGLPATVDDFAARIYRDGAVMGSYAQGAQQEFLRHAHPVWLTTAQYEQWAREVLTPEKYQEVVDRYGPAPGQLLARADSIAVACLQFGNVLLFPQPRPALGEDDFKLVHGAKVAPPHSYLAPYLYMQRGFQADALIHFGTHGNLEFTPGKNVGLSCADWAEVLVGRLPHFYLYTTGNVGESIIARRRTHAVLITYLTPPYAESGMRQRYAALLEDVHKAIESLESQLGQESHEGHGRHGVDDPSHQTALARRIKQEVTRLGLHRDLELDSLSDRPYTLEELERIDAFAEELANEKMLGDYYTLGVPYSPRDLLTTTLAVCADPLAYATARRDRDKGLISTAQLQDFTYIAHHYLPAARRRLTSLLQHPPKDTASVAPDLRPALRYRQLLTASTQAEMDALVRALGGGTIAPAPGGDPVLNPNVLPTGRNMYSVNAETTPDTRAWDTGRRLAQTTLEQYLARHGDYPRKVSYTFWAGEFITTAGATLAQALWMLGVEPVRDGQGRVIDLRLVPGEELGRPRIDVVVQVSGQLRDIAGSRLRLLTQAVSLASEAPADPYPNYVAEGTLQQERLLVDKGYSAREAREMALMRVFGPINSGYSTGIMGYAEHSGAWEREEEIADGYLNNMGALYGDDEHWGDYGREVFASALDQTDVVIQPRQSNTWGPVSLDHVYEFTGGLSLAVKTLTGREPDAYMADYRNRSNARLQEAREAIAVETRTTILNPTFVSERMRGGAGSAQMLGEMFRNIFGWHVMRPSAMDPEIFNELYDMYILDDQGLDIVSYLRRVNPAALQAMTAVLLESARKGYWQATADQLRTTATLHADVTHHEGAACTEFVCDNDRLQEFVAQQLDASARTTFEADMQAVSEAGATDSHNIVLRDQSSLTLYRSTINGVVIVIVLAVLVLLFWLHRRRSR